MSEPPAKQPERGEKRFDEKVGERAERKQRARRHKGRSVWYGLGAFGLVGWTVAIPTLLGVLLGMWLDATFPGPIPWTLVLLLIGLAIGLVAAWRWISDEMDAIRREREEKDNHE
jgi:ATP synthase protein I